MQHPITDRDQSDMRTRSSDSPRNAGDAGNGASRRHRSWERISGGAQVYRSL